LQDFRNSFGFLPKAYSGPQTGAPSALFIQKETPCRIFAKTAAEFLAGENLDFAFISPPCRDQDGGKYRKNRDLRRPGPARDRSNDTDEYRGKSEPEREPPRPERLDRKQHERERKPRPRQQRAVLHWLTPSPSVLASPAAKAAACRPRCH